MGEILIKPKSLLAFRLICLFTLASENKISDTLLLLHIGSRYSLHLIMNIARTQAKTFGERIRSFACYAFVNLLK